MLEPVFLFFEHLKDIISEPSGIDGLMREGFPSLSLFEKPPLFYGTGNIFLKKNTTKQRNCFYYSNIFLKVN